MSATCRSRSVGWWRRRALLTAEYLCVIASGQWVLAIAVEGGAARCPHGQFGGREETVGVVDLCACFRPWSRLCWWRYCRASFPWIMLILTAFPFFDTIAAIWGRLHDKRPIMSPDRAHLHHKLLNIGYIKKRTYILLCLFKPFCAHFHFFKWFIPFSFLS